MSSEIREKVNDLYALIKGAEEGLVALRGRCPHERSHVGYYAFAPGHVALSILCDQCDAWISHADEDATKSFISAAGIVTMPLNPAAN